MGPVPQKIYAASGADTASVTIQASDFSTGTDAFFLHWITAGNMGTAGTSSATLVLIQQPIGNTKWVGSLRNEQMIFYPNMRFPASEGNVVVVVNADTATDSVNVGAGVSPI